MHEVNVPHIRYDADDNAYPGVICRRRLLCRQSSMVIGQIRRTLRQKYVGLLDRALSGDVLRRIAQLLCDL